MDNSGMGQDFVSGTSIRRFLQRNPVVRSFASLNVTLVCLILLFILTLWGTIDQLQHGLYLAQQKFFYSFFFIFAGFIPFPGAHLVLWILFINLVCAGIMRLVYRWTQAGIIITHIGLLLFFVSAFVTFHSTRESHITLWQGEGSNVSQSYQDWEMAVWTENDNAKNVVAYDANNLRSGNKLDFSEYGLTVTVKNYYPNAEAYGTGTQSLDIVNATGIQTLKEIPLDKEQERNIPGCSLIILPSGSNEVSMLLYGAQENPAKIISGGKTYFMQLHRKQLVLPFILQLKDFMVEWYPNTEIARSYKSLVEISSLKGQGKREVLISMNKPLRYKDFTIYQSSYSIDKSGKESSTLAVVKNAGRLLPYFASFVTFLGMAVHFLLMAFRTKLRH